MRKIRDYIKEQTKKTNGRKRQCLTHSNRFALHLILNAKKENLGDEGYDFDTFLSNELPTIIQNTEDEIYKSIDKLYKKSLIHQIFRNQPKCRDLKQKIKVEEIKKTFPIKPM